MNPTLKEAAEYGRQLLTASDSADVDIKALLCHVLECAPSYLFMWPEKELEDEQWQVFQTFVARRVSGEPIAHMTGSRGFWTLDLLVDNSTLIPRADTELLVSLALEKLQAGMRVIDLGTGTGAIILSLAVEHPEMHFFATDFSMSALKLARKNACCHQLENVSFIQTSWLQAFKDRQFDLIISNPPYIKCDDPHVKSGDLRFEPLTALVSGADGLDDIRHIVTQARQCLRQGGWLLIEHGYDQGRDVKQLFADAGFESIQLFQDYGQQDRAVIGQLTL